MVAALFHLRYAVPQDGKRGVGHIWVDPHGLGVGIRIGEALLGRSNACCLPVSRGFG